MTEQEIEKLRDKLGDGFEVTEGYNCAVITVKDIWKGVEFADFKGSVFKIDKFDGLTFYENGWAISKYDCKPSTESAYVEQLKNKAHELFGSIKDGDRFERDWIKSDYQFSFEPISDPCRNGGFFYEKEYDILTCRGVMIYQQGKWAKKVERVKVYPKEVNLTSSMNMYSYVFRIEGSKKIPHGLVSDHLAKCLEDYLNKSQ